VKNPVFNAAAEPDVEVNIRYRPSLQGYDSLRTTASTACGLPGQEASLSEAELQRARDAEDFWIADVDRWLSQLPARHALNGAGVLSQSPAALLWRLP
jgi:hypothetical protein